MRHLNLERILNRFGTMAGNVEEIKGEMKMMQDSFSKALNPLMFTKSSPIS
jgi:DNA anti-recombination protein RmuC